MIGLKNYLDGFTVCVDCSVPANFGRIYVNDKNVQYVFSEQFEDCYFGRRWNSSIKEWAACRLQKSYVDTSLSLAPELPAPCTEGEFVFAQLDDKRWAFAIYCGEHKSRDGNKPLIYEFPDSNIHYLLGVRGTEFNLHRDLSIVFDSVYLDSSIPVSATAEKQCRKVQLCIKPSMSELRKCFEIRNTLRQAQTIAKTSMYSFESKSDNTQK